MQRVFFLNKNFYEYDLQIKKQLEKRGFIVISQNITPKPLFLLRMFPQNIREKLINKQIKYFQNKYVKKFSNEKFDIIFMLAGQGMTEKTISQLKNNYPNALFVWYIWDSILNLENYWTIKKYFDCVISFDKVEAKEYDLVYSPLFYSEKKRMNNINYGISMIGQNREYRKKLIDNILKNKIFNIPFVYLRTGKIEKIIMFLKKDKFFKYSHTSNLSYDKTIKYMAQSQFILDMPAPNQKGLTMRSIEAIGLEKKLITTNKYIKLYDFYNEKNICIINPDSIKIQDDFLKSPYKVIDKEIYEYYSLDNWIKRLVKSFGGCRGRCD